MWHQTPSADGLERPLIVTPRPYHRHRNPGPLSEQPEQLLVQDAKSHRRVKFRSSQSWYNVVYVVNDSMSMSVLQWNMAIGSGVTFAKPFPHLEMGIWKICQSSFESRSNPKLKFYPPSFKCWYYKHHGPPCHSPSPLLSKFHHRCFQVPVADFATSLALAEMGKSVSKTWDMLKHLEIPGDSTPTAHLLSMAMVCCYATSYLEKKHMKAT